MKEQFYLFKRNGIYYVEDGATGRQHSLKTKDATAARRILHAKNEAARSPMLNVAMAKVYLSARDPKMLERTWQDAMNEFCSRGKQQTQEDRRRVAMRKPQNLLRNLKLVAGATFKFHTKKGGNGQCILVEGGFIITAAHCVNWDCAHTCG